MYKLHNKVLQCKTHSNKYNSLCSSICLLRPNNQYFYKSYSYVLSSARYITTSITDKSKLRNISVIAHIDAGKTTTTERLLYYSGSIHSLGDVDSGDTVTDYLPAERERGITITAACITLQWQNHNINIIDTPGHLDFTTEVEQALRVTDGVICILDSVKGVETQTITVYKQAKKYDIPCIMYINKCDKVGCDIQYVLQTIENKLKATPLLCQLPLYDDTGNNLIGVIDVINMRYLQWNTSNNNNNTIDGRIYDTISMDQSHKQYNDVLQARDILVDTLSQYDDNLLEKLINSESHLDILPQDIHNALRYVTITKQCIPVLVGASQRNIGIQPLLDSIIHYLPSPIDLKPIEPILSEYSNKYIKNRKDKKQAKQLQKQQQSLNNDNNNNNNTTTITRTCDDKQPLTALAFKVTHQLTSHNVNTPIVFVRVYSGMLQHRQQLLNTWQTKIRRENILNNNYNDSHSNKDNKTANPDIIERVSKLWLVNADKTIEVSQLSSGQVGAIVGLKYTKVGDTLISYPLTNNNQPIYLHGISPMAAVYSRSIEVSTQTEQDMLDKALQSIQLEDSSIRIYNNEYNQTIISCQGELQMEIIAQRLKESYNIEPVFGPVFVAYRETVTSNNTYTLHSDELTNESITLYIEPLSNDDIVMNNEIEFDDSINNSGNNTQQQSTTTTTISDNIIQSIETAIYASLGRGILLGSSVYNTRVIVRSITLDPLSTTSSIGLLTNKCLRYTLQNTECRLLEPVMHTVVTVLHNDVGSILSDMTGRRRATINNVTSIGDYQEIDCDTPLSEMIGYTTELRSKTSGTASFTMQFKQYNIVDLQTQQDILNNKK